PPSLPPCSFVFLSPSFLLDPTGPSPISPLPLHDALPILTHRPRARCAQARANAGHPKARRARARGGRAQSSHRAARDRQRSARIDRKSTRLNSSHTCSSYAVVFFNHNGGRHRALEVLNPV